MARLTSGNRSVRDQVVVVTGAASGMGRAIAHLFADEDAKVAVTDRAAEGVATVVDEVIARLGPVDVLVNDAGVSLATEIGGDGFEDAWATTLAVNLTAHARMVRACLPSLVRNRSGRVINIASTEGLGATPFLSPYTASKHGVVGLTKTAALEYAPEIRVNCVVPGHTDTDFIRDTMTRRGPEILASVPFGELAKPDDIAEMVCWLSSDRARYVSGAAFNVDGALTAG